MRSTAARLSLLTAMTAVVCLGQFLPSDAGNYAARVVTLTGQVSVLKDFQPWALSVGDSIQVTQRIQTGADGHAMLQVSDGSTIEVYPNSTFVFRKNPGNWRDLIDVVLGRVRVHIEHLGTAPNPNRVITPVAVISVRGTTFDVTVNDDDDESTTIEVEDGAVEVRHNLLGGNTAVVNAGGVLRVYRNEPIAERMDKGNVARQAIRFAVNVIAIVGRSSGPGKITLPGGGNGGTVGDTGGTPPPPPPPPPPPKLP